MNAYNDIDNALGGLDIPFYHGMPEFSAFDEPERYLSYTVHEKPDFYSSGENRAVRVWAAVSVFTPLVEFALYDTVKAAMKAAGFAYQNGQDAGEITPFPCKKHYVMDFIRSYEVPDE